ncbi:helix-turn-helix domain-containing protein [bacterium]|nr:helix-turn-helix domain-containing protein [bacterium]
MEEKDKNFSKIPHRMIDSGLLAQLKPTELKVFLVINRFADYKSGISYPGVRKIGKLAGVNKDAIATATNSLVQRGLIEKKTTGKRFGFRNQYRVTRLKGIYSSLPPSTVPKKTDKCKHILRGKDGRFLTIPKNTDNGIPQNTDNPIPSKTESGTCPKNTDKIENLEISKRDNGIRDNSPSGVSNETQSFINHNKNLNTKKDVSKKEILKEADRESVKMMIQKKGVEWTKKYLLENGYDEKLIETLEESN